ncbi:MAG TPA: hypothetical protein PK781_03105 [Terrimesophilobacter sp.]|nr:hypothetical protein [Terrimesophilobacter sp.]HRP99434.1 hypothetical protein [Terrimesophilobacter sp.]
MTDSRQLGGSVVLADTVVDALEKLTESLTAAGMSATVTLRTPDDAAVTVTIGERRENGGDHVLHARPVRGEGSHFDIGDY